MRTQDDVTTRDVRRFARERRLYYRALHNRGGSGRWVDPRTADDEVDRC